MLQVMCGRLSGVKRSVAAAAGCTVGDRAAREEGEGEAAMQLL